MEFADYLIIITYFFISFGIAAFYSRRAGRSTDEFFLSGSKLWEQISSKVPDVKEDGNFSRMFINWIFGVILVYSLLFGIGNLLFGKHIEFLISLLLAVVSIWMIHKNLSSIGWGKIIE